ncbi:7079_t:CDS:1 [Funneliformis geosporum]|uniref:13308_t:CDS:1 n=1 Tax=Funneliformis geosporum TaxID=1117311 RepID=A0A9W4WPR7_9GLOM|nr:7079_t:CDS:1 [Funneliformis geosporum]CAI2162790.1 13308_t:CDS:1 [Funneliformis geosporum]
MSYQFQTEHPENPKMLRACVFIDSSNPALPNQIMSNSSHPFIKPPFPPLIDPKDLLIIGKDNKPSRSPNAFIIYRKVFFKTTRDQGYFLPMTIVSSMASKSWDQESEEVRGYYKLLAKEAYKYRTEKFPKKIKRRRKKEPWNADIAFQNDLYNTFFDDTKDAKSKKSSSSSSPLPEFQMEQINQSPLISQDSTSSNVSSQISSPNLEQQNYDGYDASFNENQFQEFSTSNNSSNMPSPLIFPNDILNHNSNQPYPEFNEQINNDFPINYVGTYQYDQCDQNLICQGNFPNQIDPVNFIPFNNDLNMCSNQIDYLNYNNYNYILNPLQYQGICVNSNGSEFENSLQL